MKQLFHVRHSGVCCIQCQLHLYIKSDYSKFDSEGKVSYYYEHPLNNDCSLSLKQYALPEIELEEIKVTP